MSQLVGSVKSGVMIGLLQHPSIVQQMQQHMSLVVQPVTALWSAVERQTPWTKSLVNLGIRPMDTGRLK
jgi:hypothetical protein